MAHTVWSRKLRKIKSQIDGDILITHVSSAMWSNNCCYKAKREFRLKTVLLKQHEGLWRWDIETWSGKSSLSESIYVIEAGTYNLTTQSTVVADSGCLKGRGQKKRTPAVCGGAPACRKSWFIYGGYVDHVLSTGRSPYTHFHIISLNMGAVPSL